MRDRCETAAIWFVLIIVGDRYWEATGVGQQITELGNRGQIRNGIVDESIVVRLRSSISTWTEPAMMWVATST